MDHCCASGDYAGGVGIITTHFYSQEYDFVRNRYYGGLRTSYCDRIASPVTLFRVRDYSDPDAYDSSFGAASGGFKGCVGPSTTYIFSQNINCYIDSGYFVLSMSIYSSSTIHSYKDRSHYSSNIRRGCNFGPSDYGIGGVGPRKTHFSSQLPFQRWA